MHQQAAAQISSVINVESEQLSFWALKHVKVGCSTELAEHVTETDCCELQWNLWTILHDPSAFTPGRQGQDSAIDPWGEEGEEEELKREAFPKKRRGRTRPWPNIHGGLKTNPHDSALHFMVFKAVKAECKRESVQQSASRSGWRITSTSDRRLVSVSSLQVEAQVRGERGDPRRWL